MPRSEEQFEELREKSREKIIAAALELFAHNGYGSTSIDSIAKKAGISKGLIYNYYENKKSMLTAIYEDAMAHGEEMIKRQKSIKNPYERIRVMVTEAIDMMKENPEYIKLLMVLSMQPGAREDMKDIAESMLKRNREMIASFMIKKDGDIISGMILDALIDGVMINYIRFGDKYPIEEIKAKIIEKYIPKPPKKATAAKSIKSTNTRKTKK